MNLFRSQKVHLIAVVIISSSSFSFDIYQVLTTRVKTRNKKCPAWFRAELKTIAKNHTLSRRARYKVKSVWNMPRYEQ